MAALAEAGAMAFSDDGRCIQNAALMRRAMETAAPRPPHHRPLRRRLPGRAAFCTRARSALFRLSGIPAAAEEIMVARDAILAEATGAPVHIAHLSTAGSVRIVREAKKGRADYGRGNPPPPDPFRRGAREPGPALQNEPAAAVREDVAALIEGVADGTIDAFATDHAPHAAAEKAAGSWRPRSESSGSRRPSPSFSTGSSAPAASIGPAS